MLKLKYFVAGFVVALYSVFGHGLDNLERVVYQETYFVQGLCRMYEATPETYEINYCSYAYETTTLVGQGRNLALEVAYKLGEGGRDGRNLLE